MAELQYMVLRKHVAKQIMRCCFDQFQCKRCGASFWLNKAQRKSLGLYFKHSIRNWKLLVSQLGG